LDRDKIFATALTHWVQIIGDASTVVSVQLKERHPEVAWMSIQGMRHRIVHNYSEIDYDILWDVVSKDIPVLKSQLQGILEEIA
jgi:uncharacterized protein with HEPN domain